MKSSKILTCLMTFAALTNTHCGHGNPTSEFPVAGFTLRTAPHSSHWIEKDGFDRLVFARSLEDIGTPSPVAAYLVCATGGACTRTETNFVDFPASRTQAERPEIVVYALDAMGTAGPAAVRLAGGARALASDSTSLSAEGNPVEPGAAGFGPTPMCSAIPPTTVYSPIFGSMVVLGPGGTNQTSREWSFWQHKSGYHKKGGGIGGADDTYAWDINLNVRNASTDLDRHMEYFPVGYGFVTLANPATGSLKIDHCGWRSAYLHSGALYVRPGDYVSPWVPLGRIGNFGATDNYHLHLAIYAGSTVDPAVSYDVAFIANPVLLQFRGPNSISIGASSTLAASADRWHSAGSSLSSVDLNSTGVNANTWWSSSNTTVLRVDGSGRMTGARAGTATVTLTYSGERSSYAVSVY